MSVFKSIICSISINENSEDIVYYTRELAKAHNAKIYVVHSLPSMDHLRQFMSDSSVADDLVTGAKDKGLAYAKEFSEKNFAGLETEALCIDGDVAHKLMDLVDKYCADLVVIGSLSTKGFFSFLHTKAPQAILGQTRVPVMVIPNELDMDCVPKD